MTPELAIGILQQCILTGALVMAPILAVGLTVGITVGAIQAATQVNEPTLTFVPKALAVGLVGAMILPWGLDRFVMLFHIVLEGIGSLVLR